MSASRLRLEEHGITWDEDGAPVGFQVGKAAAVSEWRLRREIKDPEFARLVTRLRWERWRENLDPAERERQAQRMARWIRENPDKARLIWNRYKEKHREQINKKNRAKRNKKHAETCARTTFVCLWCGFEWRPDPSRQMPRRRPKWCSGNCQMRAWRAKRQIVREFGSEALP